MKENLLRRLWHDPVWSKVIASLIMAGLPILAIIVVSAITNNPLTTIIACGVVCIVCLTTVLIYKRSHGITFYLHNGYISMQCSGGKINKVQNFVFGGRNNSDKPITKASGRVQSNITNEIYPIYFNVDGDLVPPSETNGIPPRGDFQIVVPFARDNDGGFVKGTNGKWDANQGVDLKTFLANLEDFTLMLEYDGMTHKRRFRPRNVRQEIEAIRKRITPPIKPKITRKGPQSKLE
jgi:hypothetical protein